MPKGLKFDSGARLDYSLEKGLPASLDAERSILGSVLLDNRLFDQAAEILTADDFFLDAHRRIFHRMCELIAPEDPTMESKPIDMITLSEELQQHKEIEAIGGMAYLSSLIDGVPERPSIVHYCKIVRGKAILRGVIGIAQSAIAEAADNSDSPNLVLQRAEEALYDLADNIDTDSQAYTILDSAREAGGLDAYASRILDPVALTGIPTGYIEIDRVIGGLKPATMYVVAARPSMGKSSWVSNVAENILSRDAELVIAFFMLESSRQAFETRRLAAVAGVNIRKVAGGHASEEEKRKLAKALTDIAERSLCVDDSMNLTPMKLRSRTRQLRRKKGRLDLVIVDYVQLMAGGKKFERRDLEIGFVSRSLKGLAKELKVPVIALAQLNRGVEDRKDKRPLLSDLRESGNLENDADVVLFIHRPEVYEPENTDLQGIAEITIAKNRDGPTDRCKLAFISAHTRFENLAYERSD